MLLSLKKTARNIIPGPMRRRLVKLTRWPPVGHVKFDELRRIEPISRSWGDDRGLPIDRYYIEKFLTQYQRDILGHVLEIGDNLYTRRFGGSRVQQSDVLNIESGDPETTIIADLVDASHIANDQFDCIICTQTLQFIPDMLAAIGTLHRILKPGGVLLITGSAASPISIVESKRWGEYWRFTTYGLHWLLEQVFAPEGVTVEGYGNILTNIAFMHGLATEELTSSELDYSDPQYELLVAAHAVKLGSI